MVRFTGVLGVPIPWVRGVIAAVLTALLGASVGIALAQTLGPVDARCVTDCTGQGLEGEYCARACTPPASDTTGPDQEYDWICVRRCRDAKGALRECLDACVRRR
jgi:hypothetical protein